MKIKFRAWDKTEKRMLDNDELLSIDHDISVFELLVLEGESWLTFMQYTGLKDKNGKEIYEGDIVLNGGFYKFVVSWNDKKAGFEPFCDWTFIGEYADIETTDEIEVIGNIYEHPHLLNEK